MRRRRRWRTHTAAPPRPAGEKFCVGSAFCRVTYLQTPSLRWERPFAVQHGEIYLEMEAAEIGGPGRTVEFYMLRPGVPRPSLWRKTLRSNVFSDDLREPSTSEKTAHENTMSAALSSGCAERANPLENQPRVPLACFP